MNSTTEQQSIFVAIGIGFIKSIVCAYDIVTFPIYTLIQRPWVMKRENRRIRAKHVIDGDPSSGE